MRLAQAVLAPFVLRMMFPRVLIVSTPIGRKARAMKLGKGVDLVRVKPKDLERAGIERAPVRAQVERVLVAVVRAARRLPRATDD